MHPIRRWSALLATAMLAAGLTVAPTVATAPAAPVPIRLLMIAGSRCVNIYAHAGPVTVTLQSSSGARIERKQGTAQATVFPEGRWSDCFSSAVSKGRRLVVKSLDSTRTITIIRLDWRLDRVTDVLSGHAPAGVHVGYSGAFGYCSQPVNPDICTDIPTSSVRSRSTGTFRRDLDPIDVKGRDFLAIRVTTGTGDIYTGDIYTGSVGTPSLAVTRDGAGPATASLYTPNGGLVTLKLRAPGGTVLATATRTFPAVGGVSTMVFKKNGVAVPISAGDRITGDYATDANLSIPASSMAGDSGTRHLTGTCLKSAPFQASVTNAVDFTSSISGLTDADGHLDVVFSEMEAGWPLELRCRNPRGDEIVLTGTAS